MYKDESKLYLSFRWHGKEVSWEPIVDNIPKTKLEAQAIIDLLIMGWFESTNNTIPKYVVDVELTAGTDYWKWDRIDLISIGN